MAQFPQHFSFDLSDAFARNSEGTAYFLEGVIGTVIEAKTHSDDFFLARRERLQHRSHFLFQI